MTDAEKLRRVAKFLDDTVVQDDLRRIADLLDAVPPETLAALKAGTWRVMPVEPTDLLLKRMADMFRLAWWGADNNSRRDAYRAVLAVAPAKPEGER